MLVKEQVQSVVSPRPQSFSGLMEMYEINYMQLHLLLGDIRRLPESSLSRMDGHLPLQVDVKERSRHTTTVLMTYRFNADEGAVPETRPDMLVRIYHDALQAEVISHKCRLPDSAATHFHSQHKTDSMLLCRWRMNRFLFKWVGYLRRQGYVFR